MHRLLGTFHASRPAAVGGLGLKEDHASAEDSCRYEYDHDYDEYHYCSPTYFG